MATVADPLNYETPPDPPRKHWRQWFADRLLDHRRAARAHAYGLAVGQHPQQQLVPAADRGPGAEGRAEVPLDHRIDGLALPPLAVHAPVRAAREAAGHRRRAAGRSPARPSPRRATRRSASGSSPAWATTHLTSARRHGWNSKPSKNGWSPPGPVEAMAARIRRVALSHAGDSLGRALTTRRRPRLTRFPHDPGLFRSPQPARRAAVDRRGGRRGGSRTCRSPSPAACRAAAAASAAAASASAAIRSRSTRQANSCGRVKSLRPK